MKKVPPLSDVQVRQAKATDKAVYLSDGGGLYIEVLPGGVKRWRLRYTFEGRNRLLSLGRYPAVTLNAARQRREEIRAGLAKGVSPVEKRMAEAEAQRGAAATFRAVSQEWFDRVSPTLAPMHATRVWARLEKDVFPVIGDRPIGGLGPSDVLAVVRPIEARGRIETAHRVLGNISQVFRYAVVIEAGGVRSDPTRDLSGALPAPVRGHFAATTDPQKVGGILRAIFGYQGSPIVCAALKLAPMFFVRPGELRRAEWLSINLDTQEWRYTIGKTETPHIVPLARQAVEILRELRKLTGDGQYVFPGGHSVSRPMSENGVLSAFRRMGIMHDEMTGHGWRAVARTLLDEVLQYPPHLIEHQLGHVVRDPLGRAYNRTTHLDQRRAMMQRWADYLDELRVGDSSEVRSQIVTLQAQSGATPRNGG